MILFSTGPGRLAALPDPAVAGSAGLVGMTGFPIPRSIINRLTVSTQGNFQFLHSLGGQIFIYVFGDRVGAIQVSGLAFLGQCTATGPYHGIEDIFRWYNNFRLANNDQEMEVVVGTTPLRGFLAGLTADLVSTETRIFSYTASLILVPEN